LRRASTEEIAGTLEDIAADEAIVVEVEVLEADRGGAVSMSMLSCEAASTARGLGEAFDRERDEEADFG